MNETNETLAALDAAVQQLTTRGGGQAALIVETPTDEARAFGEGHYATRQVRAAWWDLAFHWPVLPGVGEDVTVSRLASLGLTESGQATWAVYCPPAILAHFCAPEDSTYDELGAWAALTVSALKRRGDVIANPESGRLTPAGK